MAKNPNPEMNLDMNRDMNRDTNRDTNRDANPDEGCRRAPALKRHLFRRLAGHLRTGKQIFPEIIARHFRIAGTYCRQRWFVRYARSESLLCLRAFAVE